MKKVFFLGAGASRDAGYPLTKDLIKEINKYVNYRKEDKLQSKWENFNEFRKTQGHCKIILDHDFGNDKGFRRSLEYTAPM